ncbi:MAG: hypothetical protein U0271_01035 [Polyangiaceae bacterium]
MTTPGIRAAQSQTLLQTVRGLPEREQILARVRPSVLEGIGAATPLAWIAMGEHMQLATAVRDVLGPARAIETWRSTMLQSFERPFLKSFVSMTTSLLGITPSSLLRRADVMYGHVVRDAGGLRYEATSEHGGIVSIRDYPARFGFECWMEGIQGCLLATIELGRARGAVKLVESDDKRGFARCDVSW